MWGTIIRIIQVYANIIVFTVRIIINYVFPFFNVIFLST